MSFGSFNAQTGSQPMSEINVTPLVDVMLVLLVIFIITAPLLAQGIKINLPNSSGQALAQQTETITIEIDGAGQLFIAQQPLSSTALQLKLQTLAKQPQQPNIHIKADKATAYESVAKVMGLAQQAGLSKIGFVTLPDQAK
jgi:biopolymer transport protein ExbD